MSGERQRQRWRQHLQWRHRVRWWDWELVVVLILTAVGVAMWVADALP